MSADRTKLSERIEHYEVTYVKHYKGSNYLIYDVATHTETGERLVLYMGAQSFWCRPLAMFDDEVQVNGETVPRFVEIWPPKAPPKP